MECQFYHKMAYANLRRLMPLGIKIYTTPVQIFVTVTERHFRNKTKAKKYIPIDTMLFPWFSGNIARWRSRVLGFFQGFLGRMSTRSSQHQHHSLTCRLGHPDQWLPKPPYQYEMTRSGTGNHNPGPIPGDLARWRSHKIAKWGLRKFITWFMWHERSLRFWAFEVSW